jgi:hypothetical protein
MIRKQGFVFRGWSIVAVSAYLISAYLILRIRGRLKPQFSLLKLIPNPFRRRYSARLSDIHAEKGACFTVAVPEYLVSDRDGISRLQIYEDGYPLPEKGAQHERVREFGRGSFSHWGRFLYFSASDNTDPRTNGRSYSVQEV